MFKHSFLDTLNPICTCGFDIEKLNHFFFHCPRFTNERQNILLKIEWIIPEILRKTNTNITSILLYGDPSFSAELNTNILNLSIDYIVSTQRFESTLFTESWFISYIFKILVSQLTRFALFVLFYLHFIFVRFLVSSRYLKFLLYLAIVVFTFYVSVFVYIVYI